MHTERLYCISEAEEAILKGWALEREYILLGRGS